MRETDELWTTSTVTIRFPNGELQYWLTNDVFALGQTIERDGHTWVVSHIAMSEETGEPRITLREAQNDATPSDTEARDREAWNLPRPRPPAA